MPLKRKLVLYMTIPALLLIAVGATGLHALLRLERAADDILSDNYRTIQAARHLEWWLREIEEAPVTAAEAPEKTDRLAALIDSTLQTCEANITEAREEHILAEFRRTWHEVEARLVHPDRPLRSPAERAVALAPLFDHVGALIQVNEEAMFEFERKERRVARLMIVFVAVASLGALATLALIANLAAARISRPILDVAAELHGALEAPTELPDEARHDEIARLRFELTDLLTRLARFEAEKTRQVESIEGRFARVMEEVRDGLVLLDPSFRILSLNHVARQILGLEEDRGDAPALRDARLPEELRQSLVARPESSSGEQPAALTEYEVGDHLYRPRLLPIGGAEDETEAHLLVLWDVTDERRFQKARSTFIGMLSHQLKTPLTSLSMCVNLLAERFGNRSAVSDDLLGMARSDCAALSHLVADLIDAARSVSPNLALTLRPADLVRLLRRPLRHFEGQATALGIELRDELGEGPIDVNVDPVKFPWVVSNIVANALRYTPRGGRVTIHGEIRNGTVRLGVTDTGEGMPPDVLDRIFMPYESLDPEPEPSTHGLGLAIAREIIDAHGGSIRVESELGSGTTFHIEIPLGGHATP